VAQSPQHRGVPVFGLLLVAVGVLLLLQTLGLVPWAVWLDVWRLWPVLLIIAGVSILFGERARWLAALLVVVLLIGSAAFAVYQSSLFGKQEAASRIDEPLDSAKYLTAKLDFGAGSIRLSALSTDSPSLVEGAFSGSGEGVRSTFTRNGDRASLDLARLSPRWFFIGSAKEEWALALSPIVEIDLTINAGASDIEADLSGLNVTNLRLNAGASDVSLVLPGVAERSYARLDMGASHIDVRVPEGVAARISTQTGVSSIDVDEARFPKMGDYYQSPDYRSASKRVELDIRGGVTSVTVR